MNNTEYKLKKISLKIFNELNGVLNSVLEGQKDEDTAKLLVSIKDISAKTDSDISLKESFDLFASTTTIIVNWQNKVKPSIIKKITNKEPLAKNTIIEFCKIVDEDILELRLKAHILNEEKQKEAAK